MDRYEENWYASDNNLRGTPRGTRKKAKEGEVAHRPSLDGRSVPWLWEERHGQSMAWARHGHGMASVNQTRPHCVNQMGKMHCKPLATRHGKGTAWARHTMCESAFTGLTVGVIGRRDRTGIQTLGKGAPETVKQTIIFFLPNLALKLICLTFIVLEDHLLLSQLYRRTALCICFEARCRKLSRLNPFCYPPVFWYHWILYTN